jgi:hypothetical protein
MYTYLSSELSVFRGCHYARNKYFRPILWQTFTCVLIAFLSSYAYGTETNRQSTPKSRSSQPISGKYNCTGGGRLKSNVSRKFLDQAIIDALAILQDCEPCRKMFLGYEDPIDLLKWLDEDGRIVMSPEYPIGFNPRTSEVETEPFDSDTAGITINLTGGRLGAMQDPCIYINPAQFIALDIPAERFGLYKVGRAEARAIGIIHELGHVAGCIPYDGIYVDKTGQKSVENTDCIRKNCVPCNTFDPCTGVLQQPTRQRSRRRRND